MELLALLLGQYDKEGWFRGVLKDAFATGLAVLFTLMIGGNDLQCLVILIAGFIKVLFSIWLTLTRE